MLNSQRKKIKFLSVALYLLIGSTFLFSLTNFLHGLPILNVAYNFSFACIFLLLSRISDKFIEHKVFAVGLLFQIFIFGHAFFLLPGKQIEAGLGLLIGIVPAFLRGKKLLIVFVVNFILYHLVLYNANYESIFFGIYGFYVVLFILVKTIVKENNEYEIVLYQQKKQIERDAEELRKLDKLKNDFIANVSHELRTPLALIKGPIQSIIDGKKLSGKYAEYLLLVKKNSELLLRRVNELIEFSKLSQKAVKLNKEVVPLKAFFENVQDIFLPKMEIKNLKFEYSNHLPTDASIMTDKSKLEIIVINLLSNAVKHTPLGGKISLEVSKAKGFLSIIVKDTGVGISESEQDKIFDRFYKTEYDEYYEGYGLGLSLCKELVDVFNGEIWVKSKPGEGSIFYVNIPYLELVSKWNKKSSTTPHSSDANTTDVKEIRKQTRKIHTVLLVEDNYDLRHYMSSILQDTYEVEMAENGLEALEVLNIGTEKNQMPDLIVTDLMMPKMDGHSFITELKGNSKWRSIPVIVGTALSSENVKIETLRVGIDDYLVKPFTEVELTTRINKLLGNKTVRQAQNGLENGIAHKSKDAGIQTLSEADFEWLSKIETQLKRKIGEFDYTLTDLAAEMNISAKSLQSKIKLLTGLTPKKYQRQIILQYARDLILDRKVQRVGELAAKMGFTDQHYFSKMYKETYGVSPKEEFERY
ncbi:MAG: ATP-binding protein [Bacteroidota bacterium]